jgi:hypothetical protein
VLEGSDLVAQVLAGGGAVGAAFLLVKFLIKQTSGGVLDVKEASARGDVIDALRNEIERQNQVIKDLLDRIERLESKVAKLTDRLVSVRGHALVAYSIVQANCQDCKQHRQLMDAITEIIKED